MNRILLSVLTGMFVMVASSSDLWAQATAQISGSVRDQSGAVLPGVEVTATQTDTGIIRSTITNETGAYILPNLAVGPYRLEVALPGFRTFVQTGIVLQVNSNPVINTVLEVGQVTEQVEVQATTTQVETRNVGIGQVMENRRILELPLNGRNVQELVLLSGAAVSMGTTGGRTFPNRIVISTGGSLGHGTNYNLDGMKHINAYDGWAMPLPFPDALEEFRVETSGLSASNGRGSSVGSAMKSGTNAIHGAAFEFVRNDLLNARSYFAPKGSTLKRNQFGGTLGGPIVQNKLFFFGGFQGTMIRQDPGDIRSYVPTPAMLAGDFTAAASPQCNAGRTITLRAPFVNNRIDPATYSRAALNIVGRLPKSNDPCGEILHGRKDDSNEGQIVGRIDYQLSNKHSLFGRHVYDRINIFNPFEATPDNILNTGEGFRNRAHSFGVGSTYLFSPNIVNSFRIGMNRVDVQRIASEFFEFKDVGINMYAYTPKRMNINVTGGFSFGGGSSSNFTTTYYQVSDDLGWTSGTHQMGYGVHVGHGRTVVNAFANVGSIAFSGQESGLGLADFLRGRPSQVSQGDANRLYGRNTYFALYGQDTWQATRRLTVNYGVRWTPVLPMRDMRKPVPSVMIFDEARFRQRIKSTVFRNAPAGLRFHGDADFPLEGNDVFHANWWNFGPRLGIAWDVQGNGRTSVRASYGLTYEEFPLQMRQGTSIGQPPWGAEIILPFPGGGLDDPYRDVPGGNPHPVVLSVNSPFAPFGNYQSQHPDIKPTYIGSWNLTVQRQLVPDTVVSASYMGSQVIHLWAQRALNPAIFIPGVGDANGDCFLDGRAVHYRVTAGAACSTVANQESRRRLTLIDPVEGQGIGRMGEYVFGGTQHYQGMLLTVEHRARNGLAVTGNYTLSHCVGDYAGRSAMGVSVGNEETYQDANDRRRDRANCVIDVRHAVNLTASAGTPEFDNPTLRAIGSGWRLAGIYRRSTDVSLSVTTGVDRALNDIVSQRPNQVLENIYLDTSKGPRSQYLNPGAFAQPALGTLGNFGRVNVKAPGTWQLDAALSRIFQIREAQRLEFRAEAYNLTNSFRPGNPSTNLNQGTFGQILTSRPPRVMQFALKYVF